MRARAASPGRPSVTVSASLLAHVVLLAALAWQGTVKVVPVKLPGTVRGSHFVLTYLPGRQVSALAVAPAPPVPRIQRPSPRLRPLLAQTSPAAPASPQQPQASAGAGVDALGEGDMSIALMQFFPDPQPDLSRLPHGSHGDVVLEAVIDVGGRISQLTLKQGVGYGVDESVVATVQQWTFHPAMRDGKPVASQQEFHFHYERG